VVVYESHTSYDESAPYQKYIRLYECITNDNIIPDNIKAPKTKIKTFCITLGEQIHFLVFDASYDANTGLNWKKNQRIM
jgi:hypothetical protein